MKHSRTILLLSAVVLLVSAARAQTGDWQAVENLRPGTRISIRSHRLFVRDTCFFLSASDDQLVCGRLLHGHPRIGIFLPIPNEAVHKRKKIREVRLEHGEAVNSLAGAGIGAGIGTALAAGAAKGTVSQLILVGFGAVLGGSYGSEFPIIHGKVIYRR